MHTFVFDLDYNFFRFGLRIFALSRTLQCNGKTVLNGDFFTETMIVSISVKRQCTLSRTHMQHAFALAIRECVYVHRDERQTHTLLHMHIVRH